MNPFERIAYWLLLGSKGGRNRARILSILDENPLNSHRLAEKLGLDYKTMQHHLNVLEENGFVNGVGKKYGKMYMLSGELETNKKAVFAIVEKVMV